MPSQSDLNDYGSPPTPDQVEIVLLGPGYGESVVVHIGGGNWLIVDSCIGRDSETPASLNYLHAIGIEPNSSVKLIVSSHWHDDHVKGLGQVVEVCTSAKFSCSTAMTKIEFLTYVNLHERLNLRRATSGVEEIKKVLIALSNRTPIRAIENRRLEVFEPAVTGHGQECEVWSLSPSDVQIDKFIDEIVDLIPKDTEAMRRASAEGPNHVAVVLWIKVGNTNILLGSDLEETGVGTGWSAIVNSTARPSGKAEVFKVPHHGSNTSHNNDVWSKMIVAPNPVAILSPFVLGSARLPSKDDANRILDYTDYAFLTSNHRQTRRTRRPPTVERTIREAAKSMRPSLSPLGGIRLRSRPGLSQGPWSIECFENAEHLSQVS